MTSPGIHVNNVPIVADSVHIEVGVGFPCLDRAFLTSCQGCSGEASSRRFMMYQRRTAHWFHWRPTTNLTKTRESNGPDTSIESDLLVFFTASQDWCNSSQALQMNDVNIWTWVQYCLL